jgi:hypothetical protein
MLTQQSANDLQFLGAELLWPSTVAATCPRGLEAGERALANQVALEIGKAANA